MVGEFCILRTRSAGVHCGVLVEIAGTVAVLRDARRVWRWRGANSLHELSQQGAAQEWTRISEPVPRIMLLEVIEVIPCTEKASKNLEQSRWGKN